MPQGWRPEGLPPNPRAPEVTRETVIRYDTRLPLGLNLYGLLHFVAVIPMTVGLMSAGGAPHRFEVVVGAVLVLWALLDLGGIFDHRRWALASEVLRLPGTAAALAARLPDNAWRTPVQAALALVVVASWLCLWAYRREFDGAPQPPSRMIGGAAESHHRGPSLHAVGQPHGQDARATSLPHSLGHEEPQMHLGVPQGHRDGFVVGE